MYLPLRRFLGGRGARAGAHSPQAAGADRRRAGPRSVSQRTEVWMSERSLWTDAVRRAPDKIRPKLQLARVSEPAEAANLLARGQRKLHPSDPAVASESGKQYCVARKAPGGAAGIRAGRWRLSPRDAQAFNNRGVALLALGQADVARRDFEHALQLDPCLFDPRYNLLSLGIRAQPPGTCRYTAEQSAPAAGASRGGAPARGRRYSASPATRKLSISCPPAQSLPSPRWDPSTES